GVERVRLVDVLDRVWLLAERDRERREPDRSAAKLQGDGLEQLAVDALEPLTVDLEQLERLLGHGRRDRAGMPDLGHVAYATEDAVRDARRPPRARGDLLGGVVGDLDAEDGGRAS